ASAGAHGPVLRRRVGSDAPDGRRLHRGTAPAGRGSGAAGRTRRRELIAERRPESRGGPGRVSGRARPLPSRSTYFFEGTFFSLRARRRRPARPPPRPVSGRAGPARRRPVRGRQGRGRPALG